MAQSIVEMCRASVEGNSFNYRVLVIILIDGCGIKIINLLSQQGDGKDYAHAEKITYHSGDVNLGR